MKKVLLKILQNSEKNTCFPMNFVKYCETLFFNTTPPAVAFLICFDFNMFLLLILSLNLFAGKGIG